MHEIESPFEELAFSPESKIHRLLELSGWELLSAQEGVFETWRQQTASQFDAFQVIVPLDERRGDFESLLQRAFDEVQNRTPREQLSRAIAIVEYESSENFAPSEWIRSAPTRPGTIPWMDGKALIESITHQLEAAAKATAYTMPRFGKTGSAIATEFLEKTILAPSGVGSYIVTALTPLNEFVHSTRSETESRKSRHRFETGAVMRRFESALEAIEESLELNSMEDTAQSLVEAVKVGVSFELADALASFTESCESQITIAIQRFSPAAAPREFTFSPDDSSKLEYAAHRLGQVDDPIDAEVTGLVSLLSHEQDSNDRLIRLDTFLDGKPRRIRVRLDRNLYELAMDAHREELEVSVHGRITREGKYYYLNEPRDFAVEGLESDVLPIDSLRQDPQ